MCPDPTKIPPEDVTTARATAVAPEEQYVCLPSRFCADIINVRLCVCLFVHLSHITRALGFIYFNDDDVIVVVVVEICTVASRIVY